MRQWHTVTVDISLDGVRVAPELGRLTGLHGRPIFIIYDNRTEFISMAMFD